MDDPIRYLRMTRMLGTPVLELAVTFGTQTQLPRAIPSRDDSPAGL